MSSKLQYIKKLMVSASAGMLLLLLAPSCADDRLDDGQVAIVETRLDISAAGGSGFVRMNASLNLEAFTDQPSWCTATVSLDSVKVAVAPNGDMSGRTALLTVRVGERSFQIPVTQEGAILSLAAGEVLFEGGGGRKAVALKNTSKKACSVAFEGGGSWLTCEVKPDSLIFTATPANVRRRADVALLSVGEGVGRRLIRLPVEQLSLAGRYIAAYYNYDGIVHRDTVAVEASGNGAYYIRDMKPNNASQALSYRISILCTYENRTLKMNAGQALQKVEYVSPITHAPDSVTLHLMALNRSREVATFSPDASYSAEVQVNSETMAITLSFGGVDDRWNGINVEGIATGGMNAAGQYVGRFDSYIYLTLTSLE